LLVYCFTDADEAALMFDNEGCEGGNTDRHETVRTLISEKMRFISSERIWMHIEALSSSLNDRRDTLDAFTSLLIAYRITPTNDDAELIHRLVDEIQTALTNGTIVDWDKKFEKLLDNFAKLLPND
jgi:hypothetical protein